MEKLGSQIAVNITLSLL